MVVVLPIVCSLLGLAMVFSTVSLIRMKNVAKQEWRKCEQILQAVSEPMMVINSQGRIEMLNPQAQKLTGWSKEEAVGRDYEEVYNVQADTDAIAEALEGRTRSRKQVALRT